MDCSTSLAIFLLLLTYNSFALAQTGVTCPEVHKVCLFIESASEISSKLCRVLPKNFNESSDFESSDCIDAFDSSTVQLDKFRFIKSDGKSIGAVDSGGRGTRLACCTHDSFQDYSRQFLIVQYKRWEMNFEYVTKLFPYPKYKDYVEFTVQPLHIDWTQKEANLAMELVVTHFETVSAARRQMNKSNGLYSIMSNGWAQNFFHNPVHIEVCAVNRWIDVKQCENRTFSISQSGVVPTKIVDVAPSTRSAKLKWSMSLGQCDLIIPITKLVIECKRSDAEANAGILRYLVHATDAICVTPVEKTELLSNLEPNTAYTCHITSRYSSSRQSFNSTPFSFSTTEDVPSENPITGLGVYESLAWNDSECRGRPGTRCAKVHWQLTGTKSNGIVRDVEVLLVDQNTNKQLDKLLVNAQTTSHTVHELSTNHDYLVELRSATINFNNEIRPSRLLIPADNHGIHIGTPIAVLSRAGKLLTVQWPGRSWSSSLGIADDRNQSAPQLYRNLTVTVVISGHQQSELWWVEKPLVNHRVLVPLPDLDLIQTSVSFGVALSTVDHSGVYRSTGIRWLDCVYHDGKSGIQSDLDVIMVATPVVESTSSSFHLSGRLPSCGASRWSRIIEKVELRFGPIGSGSSEHSSLCEPILWPIAAAPFKCNAYNLAPGSKYEVSLHLIGANYSEFAFPVAVGTYSTLGWKVTTRIAFCFLVLVGVIILMCASYKMLECYRKRKLNRKQVRKTGVELPHAQPNGYIESERNDPDHQTEDCV